MGRAVTTDVSPVDRGVDDERAAGDGTMRVRDVVERAVPRGGRVPSDVEAVSEDTGRACDDGLRVADIVRAARAAAAPARGEPDVAR